MKSIKEWRRMKEAVDSPVSAPLPQAQVPQAVPASPLEDLNLPANLQSKLEILLSKASRLPKQKKIGILQAIIQRMADQGDEGGNLTTNTIRTASRQALAPQAPVSA